MLARAKRLFKDKLTGKNSGALLLTMRRFTIVAQPAWRRSFTARGAAWRIRAFPPALGRFQTPAGPEKTRAHSCGRHLKPITKADLQEIRT